jgi:Ca2+-binding RTX toxin-like protein
VNFASSEGEVGVRRAKESLVAGSLVLVVGLAVPGDPAGSLLPDGIAGLEPPGLCANEITGTNRSEDLEGTPNSDLIRGLGGLDGVRGFRADDCLYGGSGDDGGAGGLGADRVLGGAGVDELFGQEGADVIRGGRGRDLHVGGVGSDILRARDGRWDYLVCGPGRDIARADPRDYVEDDCERVRD